MELELDQRPVIVAIAGPNGAGKTTFFEAFIRPAALCFVNADEIARELSLDASAAAEVASCIRAELVARRESFAFETVFSDPTGEKLGFLRSAVDLSYTVVLCFVGLDSWASSATRVAMRVSQGGHDVPDEKLAARYPRTLKNLARALRELPLVYVFDNSNLADPFRLLATCRAGKLTHSVKRLPRWFKCIVEK